MEKINKQILTVNLFQTSHIQTSHIRIQIQ